MSATTTRPRPEAATPQWLLPALSFASSLYLYTLVALAVIAAVSMFAMGLTPHVISSGSMRPAMQPGDLSLTTAPDDLTSLTPSTVITYEHPEKPGASVTHRIVSVNEDGTYQTRGDANRVQDTYVVPPEHIIGVGRLIVPMIGLPAIWAADGMWVELALLLLGSLAAFAGATLGLEGPVGKVCPAGEESESEPRPPLPERPALQWVSQHAVLPILGSGFVTLMSAAVLLDRRSGTLYTDQLVDAAAAGASETVGLVWMLVVASIVGLGLLGVRRAFAGAGKSSVGAIGFAHEARRIASRFIWMERHGAGFVAALAVFVLMGAGTALAHETVGAFSDGVAGGTSSVGAGTVDAPTSLTGSAGCDGTSPEVALSWTASSDGSVSGYEVLRGASSGGSYSSVGSVSGASTTRYTDPGLSNSTTYYYVVRSTTDTSWVSPYTNEVSATTPDCSPPDMWISSLTGQGTTKDATNWTATATAEVSNDAGVLEGATVSGDWSDLTGTLLGTSSCTTDATGACSVSMDPLITTTDVTFTVTGVSEASHEYVASKNAATSVTISQP